MYPLFQLWATAYHKQYSNVTLNPAAGGSGAGISGAAGNVVNMGASDAYLSPSVVAKAPGLMNIPLVISSQMVNYNIPGLAKNVHLKLTPAVIAAIYEGKIRNWDDVQIKDLNRGVRIPHVAITTLHRSDGSGDTFIFTQYLSFANPKTWAKTVGFGTTVSFPSLSSALGENGNGGMVIGCKVTPGCIAYIGTSYRKQVQSDGLGTAMLQNGSGHFELPNHATLIAEAKAIENKTPANEAQSLVYDKAATGYPIVNYEYVVVQSKQAKPKIAQALRAFLYWALDAKHGSSSSFLSAGEFAALSPGVVALSDKQIAKIH